MLIGDRQVWSVAFPFPVDAGLPAWCVKFWTDGVVTLETHAGRHVVTLELSRLEAASLAAALRWPE